MVEVRTKDFIDGLEDEVEVMTRQCFFKRLRRL